MPVDQLKHNTLRYMSKPKQGNLNDLIGSKSTGEVETDNSYKIGGSFQTGGAVLMGSSTMRANKDSINPKINNRNKNALKNLVRIVF